MSPKLSLQQYVVSLIVFALFSCSLAIGQSVLLSPTATQTVSQPVGTSLNVNTLNNTAYSIQFNWAQSPSGSLTGGSQATVNLSPCPIGIDVIPNTQAGAWAANTAYSRGTYVLDSNNNIEVAVAAGTSGASVSWNTSQWNITNDNTVVWVNYGRVWFPYSIHISGTGTAETAVVTGGTCTSGATSGTIIFIPVNSHSSGFTVGSATAGIQEAINSVCGKTNGIATGYANDSCRIVIPPNNQSASVHYNVYSTIYVHASHVDIYGYGANLDCYTRGPCMQLGDYVRSTDYPAITVEGLAFRNPQSISALSAAFQGVQVTNTRRTGNAITMTTATNHTFQVGDLVSILATDDTGYWGDFVVASVPTTTTFTVIKAGADKALQTTPGLVALQFSAILDNSNSSRFVDVQGSYTSNFGFNDFFDIWDDENCLIDHFTNNGTATENLPNWVRSVVFSTAGFFTTAPVISFENSNITNTDGGITITDSNGVYLFNNVIEGQTLWQVSISNTTGNYQGASLFNTYAESSSGLNTNTPWAGTGIAGLVAGASTGAAHYAINGDNIVNGQLPSGGTGSVSLVYFIVADDTTTGTHTAPLPAYSWKTTGSDTPVIKFPRVTNNTDIITYDVIRMGTNALAYGSAYPSFGNCAGGSPTACGSVATGLAQCTGLVCTFTDNAISSNTASYAIPQNNFSPAGLIFWPGAIVTDNRTVYSTIDAAPLAGFGMFNNPVLVAEHCSGYGAAVTGGYVACLASNSTNNNSLNGQAALLLGDGNESGGSWSSIVKGRLNFSTSSFTNLLPHHIVTLVDSQPSLTAATFGYRPNASGNDVWIGSDVPSGGVALNQGQMAFGSPVSISSYIGNVGDNAGYLERLTSSAKTFKVPIATPATTISLSTTSLSANTCRIQTMSLSGLATSSVVKWSWASTPIGVTGYGTGGLQVSTFATANTANVVVCNITSSAIIPGAMSLNMRAEL